MTSPVVVTGLGPISSIGCGKDDFWKALVGGQHGLGPITLCDASQSESRIASEVNGFRLESYLEHGKALSHRMPRSVQFAMAASVLALQDANFIDCDPLRVAVCVGTGVGCLPEMLMVHGRLKAGDYRVTPETGFQLFTHTAACVVSSHFNLQGPIHTVSTGCNSGLDALGHALHVLSLGHADAVLVVGTDCEVIPDMLAVLGAGKSLSTRFNNNPGAASRPFDRDRDGTVIGEGAAALLLESEEHARARRAKIYARFSGYASCAAGNGRKYSHERPDPDLTPCVRALQSAVKDARWNLQDVDLINANGSSSVLYDRLEAHALAKTFPDRFPSLPVHSIKSMLGQHGAGSSALQALTACLSISEGMVPPTINHENPDPACGPIRVVAKAEQMNPQHVLVHSIGLGGFYYSCGAFEKYR